MALGSSIQEFKARIDANPKLGVGLILIVILAWGFLLYEIFDWSESLELELNEAQKKFSQVEDLAKEEFWTERKNQSQELLKQLESRLWPMQNEGLAKATFQTELTQLAEKSGLERIRIQVEKPVTEKGNVQFKRLTATVNAWYKPNSLENFLDALSKEEKQFIVQNMELRVKPFPFFKITLSIMMPDMEPKGKGKDQGGKKR